MNEQNNELKQVIDKITFKTGLNKSEIAKKLDTTISYLSDILRGRVPFNDRFKLRIFKIFGDVLDEGDLKMDYIPYNNVNENENLSLLIKENSELLKMLQKSQEQIDRLLSILENGKKKEE